VLKERLQVLAEEPRR
jgi:hypothetical protein